MASIAPYRKALPFRTMFNVLGPLINPARPRGMVLGVAEKEIDYRFAQSLREGGVERALVVCVYKKMDEISCAGPMWVWELGDEEITEGTLTPEENAETFKRLLNSGGKIPEDLTPVLEFVLMNVSALLVVAGVVKDCKEGTEIVHQSVLPGAAWRALENFRDEGQKAAAEIPK